MRTLIRAAAALAATGLTLTPAAASAAPTPSAGAITVTKAGTSFLTATPVTAGQPVQVGAATGDHLYWSFPAEAGQVHGIAATISFPKGRTGASTWTVDVFDGLRRRQACAAGAQTPTADASATSVALGCTLRRVRPWAEPWSGDPLPGTYYVRLAVTDLPEPDLGLPIEVSLLVSADGEDGTSGDDGRLTAPLVPNTRAGKVLTAEPAPEPVAEEETDLTGWLPEPGSRWVWTTAGGVIAAVAGVVGFALTRQARRP
ncbi:MULTISPECIES: peptidase [Micromonospora]|uniref:Peptidase n=1 Tax=Micromonospora solifontis TaxID=2487138 RepID=A0ABX9WE83_9ACTN|nr:MULTISPECIES: peptidase [Micromonospora]NES14215.1 peptidase [Micromonospora sp. PPF5-17B]NES37651.1 peptidase [Micromonospora solifontis]NES55836.1 peptidase [Micromonospora sp. PPF5-6]RNL98094.1 peptidase [Micromonospora solifontis]